MTALSHTLLLNKGLAIHKYTTTNKNNYFSSTRKSTTAIFLHDLTRHYTLNVFLHRICVIQTLLLAAKDKCTDWLTLEAHCCEASAQAIDSVSESTQLLKGQAHICLSQFSHGWLTLETTIMWHERKEWHSANFWTLDKIINIQEFREWADTGKQNGISEKWHWLRDTDSQFAQRQSNYRSD